MCKAKKDGERCAHHTRIEWKAAREELKQAKDRYSAAMNATLNTPHGEAVAERDAAAEALDAARANMAHTMTEHASTPTGWAEVYTYGRSLSDMRESDASLAALSWGASLHDKKRPLDTSKLSKVDRLTLPTGALKRNDIRRVGARAAMLDVGESFTIAQGDYSARVWRDEKGHRMTTPDGTDKPLIIDHRDDRNGATILLHGRWPESTATTRRVDAAPVRASRAA